MLPTVILIIISFPSPTQYFIPGLKPSLSANPSHTATFPFLFFFRTDYTIPQTFTVTSQHPFLLFSFSVLHFLVVGSVR